MKKMKIAIIISAIVVVVGLALALIGMLLMRFDFNGLDSSRYQTNTHEISEEFNNILIDAKTADISFTLSQDGACRVVCFEDERELHSVTVQDGTLQIRVEKSEWYHFVGIRFRSPSITVSLPKAAYDSLEIDVDTGDVTLPREFSFTNATVESDTGDVSWQATVSETLTVTSDTGKLQVAEVSPKQLLVENGTGDTSIGKAKVAELLQVKTGTGKMTLFEIECGAFTAESNTGDVEIRDLLATGAILIDTDTGSVDLDACDAATITIHTDTGDVSGILLSEKIFVTKTKTGDVDVPKGTSGGICEVTTDTGDIELSVSVGS